MKVLLYNDYHDHIGGVETFVEEVSSGLRQAGVQVANVSFLTSPGKEPALWRKAKWMMNSHFSCKEVKKQFHAVMETFRPDVVHLQNNKCYPFDIFSVLSRHNVPVITSFHDHHLLGSRSHMKGRIKSWIKNRFLNKIRSISDWTTCHSLRMKRLLGTFGFPHVSYIPYFVDLQKWPYSPAIHHNPNRIVFAGRIHPDKGIFVWLEALEKLLPYIPDIKLICMGNGATRIRLEKEIEKRSLQPHIEMMGHQDHSGILKQLHGARALILPSIYEEMFGIIGIEAQAAGVPVIATRVGGISEWCEDKRTGVMIAPNDPAQLAEAIQWALENPEPCKQIAAQARISVQQQFSKTQSLQKLVSLYEHVASHSAKNLPKQGKKSSYAVRSWQTRV